MRMRPPTKDEEEGEVVVQKISNDSLSIAGHTFTFDSIADTQSTQVKNNNLLPMLVEEIALLSIF